MSICSRRLSAYRHDKNTILPDPGLLLVLNIFKLCATLKNCLVCAASCQLHSTRHLVGLMGMPINHTACSCERMVCPHPHGGTCTATWHIEYVIYSTTNQLFCYPSAVQYNSVAACTFDVLASFTNTYMHFTTNAHHTHIPYNTTHICTHIL